MVLVNWYHFRRFFVIVVDGLCEAEFHRTDAGETIGSFLDRNLAHLPKWIRIICTVRTEMLEVVRGFPFQRIR